VDLNGGGLAQELKACVLLQCARQQPSFGEDLEAVTDPNHWSAAGSKLGDRAHHGREPGDGTGAKVVPVSEPSRDHHCVDVTYVGFAMPQQASLTAKRLDGFDDVSFAV
jgi:hypothetical protein